MCHALSHPCTWTVCLYCAASFHLLDTTPEVLFYLLCFAIIGLCLHRLSVFVCFCVPLLSPLLYKGLGHGDVYPFNHYIPSLHHSVCYMFNEYLLNILLSKMNPDLQKYELKQSFLLCKLIVSDIKYANEN